MKNVTNFFSPFLVHTILLLALIVLVSSTSFAQDEVKCYRYGGFARLHAMGDNPYIIDPDNIKTNPAYSSMYSNFLWGDIGSSVGDPESGYGQFVGFNFGVTKELTLGLLMTRNDFNTYSIGLLDPYGIVYYLNATETGPDIIPMDNNLEFLGSYNFENFVVGLGIAYASTSNEFKPDVGDGYTNDASQFGVNLGITSQFSSDFNFDAAFSLMMPSASYEPGADSLDTIEASTTFMLINARGFWKLNKKFTLVPIIAFYTASGERTSGGESTDLPSMSGLSIGVGLTYKVGNVLISGGPSFAYETMTYAAIRDVQPEMEDSRVIFPAWNLGAEWYFTDWLIGRVGYVASTFSETYQYPASLTTVDEYSYTGFGRGDLRFGVGFRFGGFTLDATVNDDVLREGFNLVGGGTPTFAYLSASYAF